MDTRSKPRRQWLLVRDAIFLNEVHVPLWPLLLLHSCGSGGRTQKIQDAPDILISKYSCGHSFHHPSCHTISCYHVFLSSSKLMPTVRGDLVAFPITPRQSMANELGIGASPQISDDRCLSAAPYPDAQNFGWFWRQQSATMIASTCLNMRKHTGFNLAAVRI